MIWKGRRQSGNIIDNRAAAGGAVGVGGLLVGAVVYFLMGGNPLVYLAQNAPSAIQQSGGRAPASAEQDDERKQFVSVVLADTEDVWTQQFQSAGATYQAPQLVLFRGAVRSGCGSAGSETGPFYCPADQRVYLDLSFFDQLSSRLGAGGDFAGAYVVAHEVGHHIQNLLGIERATRSQQAALSESGRNQISVQVELQADCLAGVWAKQTEATKGVLEAGDIDEALGAASAVGDDRLQERATGRVVPDSFTHGSSAQRTAAFNKGYTGGTLATCVQ